MKSSSAPKSRYIILFCVAFTFIWLYLLYAVLNSNDEVFNEGSDPRELTIEKIGGVGNLFQQKSLELEEEEEEEEEEEDGEEGDGQEGGEQPIKFNSASRLDPPSRYIMPEPTDEYVTIFYLFIIINLLFL